MSRQAIDLSRHLLGQAIEVMKHGHEHYVALRNPGLWDTLPQEVQDHIAGIMDAILQMHGLVSEGAYQTMQAEVLQETLDGMRQPTYLPYLTELMALHLVDSGVPDAALSEKPNLPRGTWPLMANELFRTRGVDVSPEGLADVMKGRKDRWLQIHARAQVIHINRVRKEREDTLVE